ncbi:MAG: hypothetical protein GX061_01755 [Eubacteriaceae bacterium]|nr:hypothetical protein [Eubacteriaceae bacterium]
MSIYLVDYENVTLKGLAGVEKLTEEDSVHIFYSEKANNITFAMHKLINESHAKIDYVNVTTGGKNSLDFQLITFLGYLIAKNEREEFFLVTKDNGFNSTAAFWEQRGVRVSLANNLMRQTVSETEKKLESLIPDFKDDIPAICKMLEQYKTKQGFNNALTKNFGSEKTGIIYKAVKPLLADKKGK